MFNSRCLRALLFCVHDHVFFYTSWVMSCCINRERLEVLAIFDLFFLFHCYLSFFFPNADLSFLLRMEQLPFAIITFHLYSLALAKTNNFISFCFYLSVSSIHLFFFTIDYEMHYILENKKDYPLKKSYYAST